MKPISPLRHARLSAALLLLAAPPLAAQSFYWNPPPADGRRDGVWDEATTSNWNASPTDGAATNTSWPASPASGSSTAIFQRPEDGTVTLAPNTGVYRIAAGNGGAYALTGGWLTATGILIVDVGTLGSSTLSIDSAIDAPDLVKTGAGELLLGEPLSGNLRTQDGTTVLGGGNLAAGATVDVLTGSILRLDGDASAATFLIDGRLAGPGTLTAGSYSLLDGAVIDGHLGEGTFLKSDAGTVLINGTLGSNTINIPAGTLVLSGGNLDDLAQTSVFGSGILRLTGDDTVGSYLQTGDGTLAGDGALTATYGARLNSGTVSGHLRGDTSSHGDVWVSGSLGGGALTVASGTLTLEGSSTNAMVGIRSGTILHDLGDLGDAAAVANEGTLTVDSTDTIGSYLQEAGARLTGSGSLITGSGASIRGGEIAGTLLGDTTITGDTLLSGTTGGGQLTVASDTLTLTGTAANPRILIDPGARLLADGAFGADSALTNAGRLTMQRAANLDTYVQGSGGRLDGPSGLTVNSARLEGGEVAGLLVGDTTAAGDVILTGTLEGDLLSVESGSFDVTGNIRNAAVEVLGGRLRLAEENIADGSDLSVAMGGEVLLEGNETLAGLELAGWLHGPGRLQATSGATLGSGALVDGTLLAELSVEALAGGTATVRGSVFGDSLSVEAGNLVIEGRSNHTDVAIRPGTSLSVRGPDALADTAAVSNQGDFRINGQETIGHYHSLSGGRLLLDVLSPTLLDRLTAPQVTLEPGSGLVLETSQLSLGETADIIDGAISGTFTDIEARSGSGADLFYSFDPRFGTIQAIPGLIVPETPRIRLFNLSWNQTQAIGAAFDDTHLDPLPAPGGRSTRNFRRAYFRDTGNSDPELRWQEIDADQFRRGDTFTYVLDPGLGRVPAAPGSQADLLGEAITRFQSSYTSGTGGRPVVTAPGLAITNRLSPEVHQGMADFTRLAVHRQWDAAMNAASIPAGDKAQIFTSIFTTNAAATSAIGNASYDLRMHGSVVGGRYRILPELQLGGFVGNLTGDVEGALVDTDGRGAFLGLFGEYLLHAPTSTRLRAGLGYGSFSYDASRRSFGGMVVADDIDADSLDFGIGLESVVHHSEVLRLIARGGARYISGDVSSFVEGGPGVRMAVAGLEVESLLLEWGLDAEYRIAPNATLIAGIGSQHEFRSPGNLIGARYLAGSTPLWVTSPGIDSNRFILGLGAWFDLPRDIRVGIDWRSELDSSARDSHMLSISGSWSM